MSNDTTTEESESNELSATDQRQAVRERYANIATESGSCCGETRSSNRCEGSKDGASSSSGQLEDGCDDGVLQLGYSESDVDAVDTGAELSLGCGNPTAIAALENGETVVDLGSGGGFDCFLASQEVGPAGQVIGVDMTPEMVETARENATTNDATNVEFRLGEIEHIPVADSSVDVIISNCVVNLSPDKPQVFREAYRVLRPGGRLAISDVVLTAEPPADFRTDPESVAACVGGASSIPALEAMLDEAGFTEISIEPKAESAAFIREWDDERDLSEYLVSATIEGEKPAPS